MGIAHDAELMVCVSHLAEYKGTYDLLDAIDERVTLRPGVSFAFVGEGPLLDAVQEKSRNLFKDKANVLALGRIDHTKVPTWMAASDFLILPSWDEGMPNVVREAHVMGRAVIATDVVGIREAVTAPVLGKLVPARQPKVLAQAVAEALEEGAPLPADVIEAASVPNWEESALKFSRNTEIRDENLSFGR